jgi:hypothetical protein
MGSPVEASGTTTTNQKGPLSMRKFVACAAAATAATMIAGTALAATPARHAAATHALQTKQNFVVIKGRDTKRTLFVQRKQLHGTTFAQAAACTAGNYNPNYCTPPTWNTLFGAFSQSGGSVTYGSTNSSICRQLGMPAPCGVYTTAKNALIVAFVASDGPSKGGQSMSVTCTTSSGGACPVTFKKVASENAGLGDSEVWYADASSIIAENAPIFVTTTAAEAGCPSGNAKCDVSLQVVPFNNAITAGASGPQGTGIGNSSVCYSSKAAPSCSVTTLGSDSLVFGAANDWGASTIPSPVSGQTAIGVADGTNRKTFYSQFTNTDIPTAGTKVTIGDTSPTNEPFNLVDVEIL